MPKRPLEQVWKNALTVVALAATVMALYLQVFERRARQEEARLAAVRLDDALAGSRARLRAEILAELREELRKESLSARPENQPIPDAVLRRLEAGANAGALEQALNGSPQEALLAGLNESFKSLARQMEESDRALRRDLEELRAATLRESDVSSKATNLIIVALICLTGNFLPSLWRRGNGAGEE
jgi:DNA-binding transcriptional ArsR family regulator